MRRKEPIKDTKKRKKEKKKGVSGKAIHPSSSGIKRSLYKMKVNSKCRRLRVLYSSVTAGYEFTPKKEEAIQA